MVFVFDLDDTVCDTDEYSEYYIEKFFKENNLPYKKVKTNARFAEMKFDWNGKTALKWYKSYGDQMMFEFPCKEGAVEFINNLYDLGHEIIIATARSTDWHSDPEGVTLAWLKKMGIKYTKLYVGRFDKEKICEFENADVFVDDDLTLCERVQDYFKTCKGNKQVFLSPTAYNKGLSESSRFESYENFYDLNNKINNMVNDDSIML